MSQLSEKCRTQTQVKLITKFVMDAMGGDLDAVSLHDVVHDALSHCDESTLAEAFNQVCERLYKKAVTETCGISGETYETL